MVALEAGQRNIPASPDKDVTQVSDDNPLKSAQERFAGAVPFNATGVVSCPLSEALGRVLGADVTAPEDCPAYHRAIVEGYVVNTAETGQASEDNPVSFQVAGQVNPGDGAFPELGTGQAIQVATGSIVPDGPVSVARMWEARRKGDTVTITRPFPPRFFVEDKGCDHAQGSLVLAKGTRIGPDEIGTIAALGIDRIEVARTPRVVLFSSGDEVMDYTEPMRPGAIRDSNAPMLAAAVTVAGGAPVFGGIMKDDFERFVTAVREVLENTDMVVIAGGTAVDGRDFISDLIREVGELLVDGVQMKSGRPLIMGVANGKPIVGVAGHPPEALRGFRLFGQIAIDRLTGRDVPVPEDPLGGEG